MKKTPLLSGQKYVPSYETCLSKTFARIKRELKEAQEKQKQDELERISKVRTIYERQNGR